MSQNKINLKWWNWSDNTSPHCKTCFSTSEWIWHAKNHLAKLQKKLDFGRPPPPRVCFQNSHIFPFFGGATSLNSKILTWTFPQRKRVSFTAAGVSGWAQGSGWTESLGTPAVVLTAVMHSRVKGIIMYAVKWMKILHIFKTASAHRIEMPAK